jgi:hypothetical protein
MTHPPYSLHVSLCDYFVFDIWERFKQTNSINKDVTASLYCLSTNDYSNITDCIIDGTYNLTGDFRVEDKCKCTMTHSFYLFTLTLAWAVAHKKLLK